MKNLINELGLSLREFSEKFEIPYNTIRQWYNEERKPPIYIKKLLNELINNQNKYNKVDAKTTNEREERTIFIVHDSKDKFHSETIARNDFDIKKKREQLKNIWGKDYDKYVTEKKFIEIY